MVSEKNVKKKNIVSPTFKSFFSIMTPYIFFKSVPIDADFPYFSFDFIIRKIYDSIFLKKEFLTFFPISGTVLFLLLSPE